MVRLKEGNKSKEKKKGSGGAATGSKTSNGSSGRNNSTRSKFSKNSHKLMHALEMEDGVDEGDEDEDEYLLPKTISSKKTRKLSSRNKKNGSRRKKDEFEDEHHDDDDDDDSSASCTNRGCSKYQKNVLILLFVLVGFGALFLTQMDRIVIAFGQIGDSAAGLLSKSGDTNSSGSSHHVGVDSVVEKPVKQDYHGQGSSTFGGINNVAHPGGAKAASKGEGIAFADIRIPVSNVGHATPSIDRKHMINLYGHYVHDEHRSPYASHLYNATKEELEARQTKYENKMKKVREEWGYWNFKDESDVSRPVADFTKIDHKDMNVDDFPSGSWQSDEKYVTSFLKEAKALVSRMKEGIYAEYGHPTKDLKTDEEKQAHAEMWKIHVHDSERSVDNEDCIKSKDSYVFDLQCGKKDFSKGVAEFGVEAWTRFVKKLLHAMVTNDEFYVVLGGHSAAAGHGNDFLQNRILHGFHHIMEPVMDKLGIRLISRNMGMGGVGTLQFTLAGGDLYGEADLIEWDSGMTEKGPPVDMFFKQAILSGERVPLIVARHSSKGRTFFNLDLETNKTAMFGTVFDGDNVKSIMAPNTDLSNAASKPYASRWFNQKQEKYNAICWEPRSDFEPTTKQAAKPGSQVSWHPGNRVHTWEGRRVALIVLEGLQHALQIWENELSSSPRRRTADNDTNGEGCCPLATKHWHVGDMYKEIRQNLRTFVATPKDSGDIRSECEKLIPWIPRICRVQMHGYGMWNPRAHIEFDFLNLLHEAPNGYRPTFLERNIYDGFDLMPLAQELADEDVDVHAIAIATSNPPPDIDHSWIEDNDDSSSGTNNTEGKPPTRRWLRDASEDAFRRVGSSSSSEQDTSSMTPSNYNKNMELVNSHSEQHGGRNLIRTPITKDRKLQSDKTAAAKRTYSENDKIVPGRGWIVHGWNPVKGFCDGSSQSECSRYEGNNCLINGANDKHLDVIGNALSGWLVFTVPDVREGIILIRWEWWCDTNEGLNDLTKGWTDVNDGKTLDTTPWEPSSDDRFLSRRRLFYEDVFDYDSDGYDGIYLDNGGGNVTTSSDSSIRRRRRRKLKRSIPPIPDDMKFDIVLNNKFDEMKTMTQEDLLVYKKEFVKNVAPLPIMNDPKMSENANEDEIPNPVEVAIRFRSETQPQRGFCISHVYYA